MFRLGIDASGGDNGEIEVCKAVAKVAASDDTITFYVFGDKDIISESFDKLNFTISDKIIIIDAKERISMNDHPVFALRNKTDSSIVKAGKSLLNNEIDAFISAGNTGALVALAQFYLKPINGIDRPVVAAIIPTDKSPMLLIDSGCNVDSKPEWLYQYALISNEYYKLMFKCENPSIGLLSVGTEENKGNMLTLEAYKLISSNDKLNFIGNVEARNLVDGICDIVVTDGFAGNVFLKTYEGTAKLLLRIIKEQIMSSFITKIGGLLIKPALKKILTKYDAKIYGGAPILGTNYLVLKCHGNSTSDEYVYAIKQANNLNMKGIINVIKNNIGDKYEFAKN